MTQQWGELLAAMVQSSEHVAEVEMGSKHSTEQFMFGSANGSRVAGQYERALFTDEHGNVIVGDPSKAAIYNQITRLRSKAPSENEQNIRKLFDAVMALMEVCDSEEARELLDEMNKRYESVVADIQQLEDKLQQRETQEAEKEKRKQDEAMAEDDASKQIEDTIKQEQNSIKELEREMTRNKKKIESIDMTLAQLQAVNEQVEAVEAATASINTNESSVVTLEMIEELQAAIMEKQRQLDNLDKEEMEEMQTKPTEPWLNTIAAPLASTKAMDKLKLAIKRNKRLSSHGDNMDIVNNELLKQRLMDIIAEIEQCTLLDSDTVLSRNISEWLVDRIASGNVSISNTSDRTSMSGETIMAALVLQTLHANEGQLSFMQLKEQVLHHALDQQCDAQQAIRAVYTLVANALVDIDRSTRDNMVRLI